MSNPTFTVVAALLAFVPIVLWMVFFYVNDPRPEPKRLLILVFLLGVGATVPAAVWNATWQGFLIGPYLALALPDTHPVIVGAYFLMVGAGEELFKVGFAWLFVSRLRKFDEPIDGIIYFTCLALGFAAAENFDYVLGTFRGTLSGGFGAFGGLRDASLIAGERALVNTLGHVAWTALVGYVIGRQVLRGRVGQKAGIAAVIAALVAAILLHALFDLSHVLAILTSPRNPALQFVSVLPVLAVSLGLYLILFVKARRETQGIPWRWRRTTIEDQSGP